MTTVGGREMSIHYFVRIVRQEEHHTNDESEMDTIVFTSHLELAMLEMMLAHHIRQQLFVDNSPRSPMWPVV